MGELSSGGRDNARSFASPSYDLLHGCPSEPSRGAAPRSRRRTYPSQGGKPKQHSPRHPAPSPAQPRASEAGRKQEQGFINQKLYSFLPKQEQHFKVWQHHCSWQNYPDCFAVLCPGSPWFYFGLTFPIFKFKK